MQCRIYYIVGLCALSLDFQLSDAFLTTLILDYRPLVMLAALKLTF